MSVRKLLGWAIVESRLIEHRARSKRMSVCVCDCAARLNFAKAIVQISIVETRIHYNYSFSPLRVINILQQDENIYGSYQRRYLDPADLEIQ